MNNCAKIGAISATPNLRYSFNTPSAPPAFPFFIFLMASATSSGRIEGMFFEFCVSSVSFSATISVFYELAKYSTTVLSIVCLLEVDLRRYPEVTSRV